MNKNYESRDQILFGKYDPESYFGGCKRFHCSYGTMKRLVEENFIELNECQNESPSTKDFMESFVDFDDVIFNGYAISPNRDDYRVTIEGFDIEIPDTDFDKITFLVETFHFADEFSFQHNGDTYYMHAWWD